MGTRLDWSGLGVGTGLDFSVLGQTSLCWQTGLDWSVLVLSHTHLYWVRLVHPGSDWSVLGAGTGSDQSVLGVGTGRTGPRTQETVVSDLLSCSDPTGPWGEWIPGDTTGTVEGSQSCSNWSSPALAIRGGSWEAAELTQTVPVLPHQPQSPGHSQTPEVPGDPIPSQGWRENPGKSTPVLFLMLGRP